MSIRSRLDRRLAAALTPGRRLHRVWWQSSARSYLALKMWRPMCWLRGYHAPHHCDVHFENCVWCWKPLWSRSEGTANPFLNPAVDRAPLRRRRMARRTDR